VTLYEFDSTHRCASDAVNFMVQFWCTRTILTLTFELERCNVVLGFIVLRQHVCESVAVHRRCNVSSVLAEE
jgi:hypothetical protein